jgi:hypothetical protein
VQHPNWSKSLLRSLELSGGAGLDSVRYLREHGVKLALRQQASGAQWRPWKQILLRPKVIEPGQDLTYAMSLIVHEVRHLQQGWLVALSVFGELEAWQLQFKYLELIRPEGSEYAKTSPLMKELLDLPLGWDRGVLRQARMLMRAYGGPKYRADLLPLYPLHKEVLFLAGVWSPRGDDSQPSMWGS